MIKIKGIDVSKWQGEINWNKVKTDGIEFAVIRATYGKTDKDPNFEVNYEQAKNAGIALGAYHYCYAASIEEAKQEADNFVSAVKGKNFEYPLVVDMEDKSIEGLDKAVLTGITNAFLSEVAAAGFSTMVYASKNWFDTKLDASKLQKHKIWIARYNEELGYSGRYDMWQYSSSGEVQGISAKVDLNYCFTDIAKANTTQTKASDKQNSGKMLSIKDVQEKLNSTYGLHIAADNKFGPETLKAIIDGLQTELNKNYKADLKVDSMFGPATRNKLITIKKGDDGSLVFLAQALLLCRGYGLEPYGADGSFGTLTETKVKSYQKAQGLCVDGIVGAATWSKLLV